MEALQTDEQITPITTVKRRTAAAGRDRHRPRSLKTAGVEVRSSPGTSTSTRNPRSTPTHPHSTRKSRFLLVNVLGSHVGDACARADGRGGDGIDGPGQALVAWRREHEGGSDARVTQACPSGVPVKIKQSGVSKHARDRVGVRGPSEFVDNGRVGVGRVQCRKTRTGHEARVGDADGGSREVVVAVVIVVDESPAECIVSCARVVVGAVGAFRGEAAFEGFAHRFGQERPGDGIGRRESVPVKCGDAWRVSSLSVLPLNNLAVTLQV